MVRKSLEVTEKDVTYVMKPAYVGRPISQDPEQIFPKVSSGSKEQHHSTKQSCGLKCRSTALSSKGSSESML